MTKIEDHPDIEWNGVFYVVTTPFGDTWSFDDAEMDIRYARGGIYAWTKWYEFLRAQEDEQ